MKNQGSNLSRRKVLLGGSAGVAAVTAWQTPILKSVVLPAHAQTSMLSFFGGATVIAQNSSPSLLDKLLPVAHAGLEQAPTTEFTIVIVPQGGAEYRVDIFSDTQIELGFVQNSQLLHGGSVTLGTPSSLAVVSNPCDIKLAEFEVNILSDNGDSIDIDLVSARTQVNVPAGSGMLPTPQCVYSVATSYFDAAAQGSSAVARAQNPLEHLVAPAYAQQRGPIHGFSIELTDFDELTITQRNPNETVLRRGVANASGLNFTLNMVESVPDCGGGDSISGRILSIDDSEIQLLLELCTRGDTVFTVPAASLGALPLIASCDI